MARFTYWMVYLPQCHQHSFLLFVFDTTGSTKLRDYSNGREGWVAYQPTEAEVRSATVFGDTRFECIPHKVTDVTHWVAETERRNHQRFGRGAPQPEECVVSVPRHPAGRGRATRGSQRQVQDYVNQNAAILGEAISHSLSTAGVTTPIRITWTSPLAAEQYAEYRDEDFLRAVGLPQHGRALREFWPANGPCWDALGTADIDGKPAVLLVEAKSHTAELQSECRASSASLVTIESALAETRAWCGATRTDAWTGSLYQYANRLAHLYFLRQRVQHPAWLVNLYFLDDPIGPTTHRMWAEKLAQVKADLGLPPAVPGIVDVFLPALTG